MKPLILRLNQSTKLSIKSKAYADMTVFDLHANISLRAASMLHWALMHNLQRTAAKVKQF